MLRKSGIIFVMLIAVAILVTASASAVSADKTQKNGNNGWVINQGNPGTTSSVGFSSTGPSSGSISALSASTAYASGVNYIVQGQSSYFSSYIPSDPGFTVDLNWGNSANSLQLMVFTADGAVLGPYYDGADSRIDGRTCLYFSKGPGTTIPAGTYYLRVYGYQVTGAQSYTI
jgi:hypothetical protein